MLLKAYFLAIIRFDTAENEPAKNLQNFANFPNFANPNPTCQVAVRARRQRTEDHAAGELDLAATKVREGEEAVRARYVIKSVICDPNFDGLVLGCIETDFCNQILVGIRHPFCIENGR